MELEACGKASIRLATGDEEAPRMLENFVCIKNIRPPFHHSFSITFGF